MGWIVFFFDIGPGEANPVTLVGSWANVIEVRSENQRIECKSSNVRLEV